MIEGVDVGSYKDFGLVEPEVGLNRSSSTFNPKEGKTLHMVAVPEKGLCQQNSGHDRALATAPMEAYFHHACLVLLTGLPKA
jgi:hypothetical protein